MSDGPDNDPLKNASEIGAWVRGGEAEFFDTHTPLSSLLSAESPGEEDDRSMALTRVMAYLFSSGPHPARVMWRLYLLTKEVAPELLKTLSPLDLHMLTSTLRSAHDWRLVALLRGTRVESRPPFRQDKVISDTLAYAHQRLRSVRPLNPIELKALLRLTGAETLTEYEQRMDAIKGCLRFFFFDGPQPEETVVRVFAIAKAHYPVLIFDMGVRQLGSLFGVTGAAWSERIKQKFNRLLELRGAAGAKARFQKSDEACANYAQAQKGNTNRLTGQRHAG